MSALDEILTEKVRRRRVGCSICGGVPEAQVGIRLLRVDEYGAIRKGKGQSVSRTVSMCGEHAAQTYRVFVAQLEGLE